MSQLRCTNSYSESTAQTGDFAPGWTPVSWIHGYNSSIPLSERPRLERAFLFTPPSENSYKFDGKITSYPSGGYVADLTEDPDEASRLLAELESSHWIDQYSRAVVIEFNVLNPNSKLFNEVVLAFEYTNDGSSLWTSNVNVIQLYRYAGSAGVVALLSEIGCGIFVLVITILEVIKIVRMRLRYFKEIWNVAQWSAIVLFYVAVGLYTMRCLWTVWVVEDLMNNPGNINLFISSKPFYFTAEPFCHSTFNLTDSRADFRQNYISSQILSLAKKLTRRFRPSLPKILQWGQKMRNLASIFDPNRI